MTDSAQIDTIPAWAHRTGLLALGPALPAGGDAGALDRHLICERIARYCWAYDERREELLADCFTEDGVWEGDVLGKVPIGPFEGRDKVRRWLSGFWPHQHDQRRHMILNTLVEAQRPDTATTLSYLLLMGADGTAVKLETTGFYRVDYRKEGDTWRIARLTAGFDAPFWPGSIETMSDRGRARHGVAPRG